MVVGCQGVCSMRLPWGLIVWIRGLSPIIILGSVRLQLSHAWKVTCVRNEAACRNFFIGVWIGTYATWWTRCMLTFSSTLFHFFCTLFKSLSPLLWMLLLHLSLLRLSTLPRLDLALRKVEFGQIKKSLILSIISLNIAAKVLVEIASKQPSTTWANTWLKDILVRLGPVRQSKPNSAQ